MITSTPEQRESWLKEAPRNYQKTVQLAGFVNAFYMERLVDDA